MSAEIINLKDFRKRQAKLEKQRQAEENRVRFGRSKAEKLKESADKKRHDADLDGKKRDPES
ncbi:MAG: DUF4169 family protein [Alphaproteobacteria bacterium]|nr:DUF4169 family protein [Alphaproteobacteria bacterium]MBU0798869.1 DUF4169 family protein [Alphaproteobacteria bacterium]MBU0888719.1 DUF4169 family protein [Alphaproteobacteria bacterium]MBU1813547.1 DUF4169 family protein [Alphaproteobacteria bacterium]